MLNGVLDGLITVAAFVAVLSVVVFVHEFGHFQAARWRKVAIDTFSIGFGRTLLGWRDRQGVQWKIGALPLGGYVKFQDDADPSSTAPVDAPTDPEALAQARAKGLFHAQGVGTRAFVAAAGPLANFIFAIIAFAALLMAFGRDVTPVEGLSPRVDSVQAGSPAAAAGLMPGDVIVAIGDRMIGSFGEMQALVSAQPGKPLRMIVDRQGERVVLTATPEAREGMDAAGARITRGVLGVGRETRAEERKIVRLGPLEALAGGAKQTWEIVATTGAYVGNIFSGKASAEHIAGPLGIMDMSGQVAKGAERGATFGDRVANLIGGLIGWAATLSVAVGIVNLLPIPVLDGGHLLFYGIEAARGRPLDPRAQLLGFRAGLAVIGSLFLFATWNDLQRLNVLEFLRGILS